MLAIRIPSADVQIETATPLRLVDFSVESLKDGTCLTKGTGDVVVVIQEDGKDKIVKWFSCTGILDHGDEKTFTFFGGDVPAREAALPGDVTVYDLEELGTYPQPE